METCKYGLGAGTGKPTAERRQGVLYRAYGNMSYYMAKKLFCDIDCAEAASIYVNGYTECTVGLSGAIQFEGDRLSTDADFWRVFDFTFVSGHPYSREEAEADSKVMVLSESLAREVFGSAEAAIGHTVMLDYFFPYTVKGVVKDVSILASSAYATVWTPLSEQSSSSWYSFLGPVRATILARDRSDFPKIRSEIERRKQDLNSEAMAMSNPMRYVDHGSPFTQEKLQYAEYSNVDVDDAEKSAHRTLLLTYAVLLLIPAINLSSMTQSRLRQRVGEIGVRRAFGCTRMRLVVDIIRENFAVTLIGGVIGLILSFLVSWLYADMLFTYRTEFDTNVTPGMLLQWPVFLWTLFFCFILNLLSSGIPAWKAVRMKPTEAIGGMQK